MENVNVSLRRSTAVAAVLAVPLLSSCGFDRPTDRVYTPSVGVNERAGTIDVLHALVVSGADGSGTFVAALSNNDTESDDELVGIAGSGPDRAMTARFPQPVEIPAGRLVQLADEGGVRVRGEAVRAGAFVELTLTFAQGESVNVEVPVVARRGEYAEIPVPSVAPVTEAPEEETSGH